MGKETPTSNDCRRLFLALCPDAGVRHALQGRLNQWIWPAKAAPVRLDSLHLTLHFLGNVPHARLPELVQGLQVSFPRFELGFNRATLWPHGIAVLVPEAAPDALLQLHASLAVALRRLALPIEARPYRPHVTLARRAEGAAPPAPGSLLRWPVQDYALMESCLGNRGEYRVVQRYPCIGGVGSPETSNR
jgi:2'-5' RNA ligase